MVELRAERRVTRANLEQHPILDALSETERHALRIIESPWMPLDPDLIERYPEGRAVDRYNVAERTGCDNVLQTYTVQADGRVGSCGGIGMRLIPELNVTTTAEPGFLRQAMEEAEDDFLAWGAEKNPSIAWEGRYGHRCQACARLYRDPDVRRVILEHPEERVAHVLSSAWIDERYARQVMGEAMSRRGDIGGAGISTLPGV